MMRDIHPDLTCRLCKREQATVPTKKEGGGTSLSISPYCKLHLAQRDKAARILGLPAHYASYLHRIPKATSKIAPEEVKQWMDTHQHPEIPDNSSIGGSMSTTLVHTSIGDMRTLRCGICGLESYVTDEF